MPHLVNGVVTCPYCHRVWRGRAVRGGLAHHSLTARQRQALAWFAGLVPGFWSGAEWRLHELLERARPTDSARSVQLRRKQLMQRVQSMTQRGVLVYRGEGTYALSGRWVRIAGTMPATAADVQPAPAAPASPGPQADDAL